MGYRMMGWIIPALGLALLAGCATTEKYEAHLNAWVGRDVNELVDAWGYADKTTTAPNGNTVYIYTTRTRWDTPGTRDVYIIREGTGPYQHIIHETTIPGQSITLWCKTFFEVDKNNIVVKWRWRGNDCRSR